MFILSKDERKLINLDNIVKLSMHESYSNSENWVITASYKDGYITLDKYYTEKECEQAFGRLCHIISKSKGG